jgi:hypothetical protein
VLGLDGGLEGLARSHAGEVEPGHELGPHEHVDMSVDEARGDGSRAEIEDGRVAGQA